MLSMYYNSGRLQRSTYPCFSIFSVRHSCQADLCRNGAKCIEHESGFKCICSPGYKGSFCDGKNKRLFMEIFLFTIHGSIATYSSTSKYQSKRFPSKTLLWLVSTLMRKYSWTDKNDLCCYKIWFYRTI